MDKQREKMEHSQREKEKHKIDTISKKWTKREEADFFKTVSSYGIDYDRKKKSYDWTRFKTLSKLDKKSDDLLTEYYKNFILMCKKQCGMKIDEDLYDSTIETISDDKAKRTLDRIELLSKIREDIIVHPHLDERMKLCQTSADVPDWWISGKHDRDLLIGVAKHGLGRTDYNILNDPELSFQEILRKKYSSDNLQQEERERNAKEAIKLENTDDILKFDKNEILFKLEKGEGTLKIEKVALKKETEKEKEKESDKKEKPKESDQVELTLIKNEKKEEEKEEKVEKEEPVKSEEKESEPEKGKDSEEPEKTDKESEKEEKAPEKEAEKDEEDQRPETKEGKGVEKEVEAEKKEDEPEKMETDDAKVTETKSEDKETEEVAKTEVEKEEKPKENEAEKEDEPTEVPEKKDEFKEEEPKKDVVEEPKPAERVEKDKTEEKEESKEKAKPEEKAKPKESKKNDLDREMDVSKQAAELKAMFPDLEVIQPLTRLSQIDTFVLRDQKGTGALDFSETTVAQMFNNAIKWPKEHAIHMRLQHICYCVENGEWPASKTYTAYSGGKGHEFDTSIHDGSVSTPKRDTSTPMSVSEGSEVITITTDHCLPSLKTGTKRKRHIAIDVETERAKLHALLNSAHSGSLLNPLSKPGTSWDNDDSEDSRRSTPSAAGNLQPPPAHQNAPRVLSMPYDLKYHVNTKIPGQIGASTIIPGTSSTLTPIDLSSSLPKMNTPDISKAASQDALNEIQDFSMPSKKQAAIGGKGKLDDMLNKLKKKNNCPIEEPITGSKEKKRRKLDEIVLGLSAAKEQTVHPEPSKKPTITPSVTVTPTSAPISSSHQPAQKPFTITVTSVPSPAPNVSKSSGMPPIIPPSTSAKDSFSTFLAQAEQQNLMLKKQQQQQRKSYEAMIADISKVADFSSKVNSYSHEAKVNKWLAEQNSMLPNQQLAANYLSGGRSRGSSRSSTAGIDPSLLDWKKLADPKWAELIKEQAQQAARGSMQHELSRQPSNNASSSNSNNKKGPGRPPSLSSPIGSKTPVSSANLPTSLASSLQFPSLSTAGLSGLNSNLLSSLSLGQFDPKTNPLLLPFGGLPNMSALNSMGGLGSLGNMNLFANLAGLGIPGLGMDGANLTENASTGSSNSSSSKNKSRSKPPSDAHSSSKPPVSSSSGNTLPTTSPFPFFFQHPSLLYTPLGLGGLNPFSLQPGMSAAYDSLAQQCGLLNGALGVSSSSPTSRSTTKSSSASNSKLTSVSSTSTVTSSSATSSKHRSSSSRQDPNLLQQSLFLQDAHLLETLSRVAGNYEPKKGSDKKEIKNKALESLSKIALPPEYSAEKMKSKHFDKLPPDLSKFMEIPGSSKRREQEMKEALEQLSKTSAEFIARTLSSEEKPNLSSSSNKRSRESSKEVERHSSKEEEPSPPPKKVKETHAPVEQPSMESLGVDIEALLPPSTVVKTPLVLEETEKPPSESVSSEDGHFEKPNQSSVSPGSNKEDSTEHGESSSSKKSASRRTRGKRKSGEIDLETPVVERKNLRSSAGRAAAAAAARAEAERRQLQAEKAAEKAAREKDDS